MIDCRRAWRTVGAAALLLLLGASDPAQATPEFGRRWNSPSCNTCHTVVPKLNERGMDFLNRGYQPDPNLNQEPRPTVPVSVWLTQNYDDQIARNKTNNALGKIELVSGGNIGKNVAYFAEWRVLSLEPQANGSLRDRSGRFEDLWMSWRPDNNWTLQAGQYRPLFQVEPGRKLSISTPLAFDSSLEGETVRGDARITSLRSFSTNLRNPSLTVGYQSVHGERAMDGLFHYVTLAFPGEISIPLNKAARTNASNEFEDRAKGVVAETYWRDGFNSIGAHAYVGTSDRLEIVGVGEWSPVQDLYLTGALGFDNRKNRPTRVRRSLEVEWLPTFADDTWRPGLGFRVEDQSNDTNKPAYIPYFVVSVPNDQGWSGLLQLEYRGQASQERLRLDLSILF